MKILTLIIISILPVIILGHYIYKKDRNKEPRKLLIKLFLSGILSIFFTVVLTLILSIFFPIFLTEPTELDLINLIFYVFIGIAFIEEFSKWIMTYLIGYNHEHFDEIYDMIIYAAFVSLGFASLENILYVLSNGFITGILRAILSVPGHACDGIIMGYYLGLAKQKEINNNKKLRNKNIALSLLIPILFHGIFDYCLFTGKLIFILLFFIFVIFMYIYAHKKIKIFTSITTKLKYKNNYCPNCGYKVNSNYCPNCGNKNE